MRGFTVLNMHASKGAYPFLGCKGSDTIVILKWIQFFSGLQLQDPKWSLQHRQVLTWIMQGARAGLSFSQGIHSHGLWLRRSCVVFQRHALQTFGTSYAKLANFCMGESCNLFGMVPNLHAFMHFRADCDDAIRTRRQWMLNPCAWDNSMSEDFIGRISRQSRRISFKKIERSILLSYQTKAHFAIERFKKKRRIN